MADTIFTKIINGEIPCDKVYEDDLVLAFRDIKPQAPTHILIIPKEPIPTVDDLQENHKELAGHILLTATRIAREEGLADDGYRLVFNCRDQGGQEVYHIHMHLLGGRQMNWPPG
ncbi:MAG: histidine triad nucleotide-binding protein [Candidatus Sumerlaeia bacterium]|nr:histidine triad nucleotide-binding protein [Candidatus Sumerlaeia bacterium]